MTKAIGRGREGGKVSRLVTEVDWSEKGSNGNEYKEADRETYACESCALAKVFLLSGCTT